MTKSIALTQGYETVVDEADFEWLSRWKWQALVLKDWVYATRQVWRDGVITQIYMHRAILNAQRGKRVDHANGDGLDNQRSNIRVCTTSQNAASRHHPVISPSGFHGVSLSQKKY